MRVSNEAIFHVYWIRNDAVWKRFLKTESKQTVPASTQSWGGSIIFEMKDNKHTFDRFIKDNKFGPVDSVAKNMKY